MTDFWASGSCGLRHRYSVDVSNGHELEKVVRCTRAARQDPCVEVFFND